MPKGIALVWTDEMLDWLQANIKGRHYADLAKEINAKFGCCYNGDAVSACAVRHGWRNGIDGRIKKGNIPPNKGKKVSSETYAKMQGTMFKKGQMPHNWRPTGSERLNADGYWYVKTGEPKKWELKHNLIWEQHHGKLKKGEIVIFLDGDRNNCKIENLQKITRRQSANMSFYKLWQKNAELTKTGLNVADLLHAVVERKKNVKRLRTQSV